MINFSLSRFDEVMSTLRDTAYVSGTTFSYSFGEHYVSGWGISSGPGLVGDMNPA